METTRENKSSKQLDEQAYRGAFLPANEKTWTFVNPTIKSKLQPSGLFRPVKINYY